MIDHAQVRGRRESRDDAENAERRLDEAFEAESPRNRPQEEVRASPQALSLDALVAERRPTWYAPRAESPAARRFRRRINAGLIVVPLFCLAALSVYASGLHVMVIWPDGGRPKLHYFWMANGQEVPSPVARIIDLVGAKSL